MQRAPGVAADRAAEDRVVPVHRERRLVQEAVAVLAQRVAEPAGGELPLGLRLVEQLGERERRRAGRGGCSTSRRAARPRWTVGPAVVATPAPRRCRRTAAAADTRSRAPRRTAGQMGARRTPGRGARASGARPRPRRTPPCWSRRWRPRPRPRRSSSATSRRAAGSRAPTSHARSAASYRPPTSSAIAASTWFQTSVCPPTVHGTAPSRLLHRPRSRRRTARPARGEEPRSHRSRRRAAGLVEVDDQALPDQRVERLLGPAGRAAAPS